MEAELVKFEQDFELEEQELIVLVKSDVSGAAVIGDYRRPITSFIASLNVDTGVFCEEEGTLTWMYKKAPEIEGWKYNLKGMSIYHVRVRKCIPKQLESNISPIVNNKYLLLDVSEWNNVDERFEEIRAEYQKPVYINDEKVGQFKLDREYDWYEGCIDWLGTECRVMLELDDGKETANRALNALKKLVENLEQWNLKIREFAANKLVELANDWQQDSEEEATEITKEVFQQRMNIDEISMDENGDMEVTFLDDDMFWGHYIVVYANISGKMNNADIEG